MQIIIIMINGRHKAYTLSISTRKVSTAIFTQKPFLNTYNRKRIIRKYCSTCTTPKMNNFTVEKLSKK